jgi:hypothetical protein
MVGLPGLFAIIGALNLMLFGGALAAHYGIMAGLAGGAVGGVLGLLIGFALGLLAQESERWLKKLEQKRPLAEVGARIMIFIVALGFFAGYWVATKHVLLLPLKERVRAQSAKAAQERLARDASSNINHTNKAR